jgi:hypothetical protein
VFDEQSRIRDESVERQLFMLGREVVRVAERFVGDERTHRADECARAAEAVAATA